MLELIITWLLSAVTLMLVGALLPGVQIRDFKAALWAAVIIGLINTLLRPVLFWLTIPLTLLTLGAFYLALNGLLFWMAGSFSRGFRVSGFWAGLFGAILYGIINWALTGMVHGLLPQPHTLPTPVPAEAPFFSI